MSGFTTTSDGKVLDPNGQPFTAAGLNVMWNDSGWNIPSASTLQSDFPGVNFVRLAIYNYEDPSSIAAYVNDLTSHGIVVELENHNNGTSGNAGGSSGVEFSGQQLQTESNWYASVATYFKGNPYVWFGTNNEPSETDSSGNQNAAALSDWQLTTYNAIRNTGNTAPVMLEANGWPNNGQPVMLQGYKASDYSGMTNTIWDMHYYGWLTGGSTDQATNNNFIAQAVQQVQQITSASGKMPVLIGEYGNSTTGQSIDANADQVLAAVQQEASNGTVAGGAAAWAWGSGNPGDGLTDGGTGLSSYGQEVAGWIASEAAKLPSQGGGSTTPVGNTGGNTGTGNSNSGSGNSTTGQNVVLSAASGGSFTDAAGNTWTIANGVVQENGKAAGYSANVVELADVKGTIWQENTAGNWYSWTGSTWSSATTTSPVPQASPDQTVVLAGSTSTITDASGNTWSLSGGVVDENGAAAGFSANVKEIAYASGVVWQENADNLWWSWTGTGWDTKGGTSTSPLSGPVAPPLPPPTTPATSPDGTVILAGSGQTITDDAGNAWSIAIGVVDENGKAAGYSANVSELAYVNHTVWQENADGNWWSWNGTSWPGSGTSTSPVVASTTPEIDVTVGGNTTKVSGETVGSTTASGSTLNVVSTGSVSAVLGNNPISLNFLHMNNVDIVGGSGTATITADQGKNLFVSGAGSMTVTGGSGQDTYFVIPGSGKMSVTDFSEAKGDALYVSGALQSSYTSGSDQHGGTLISFGTSGSSVDLLGVVAAPKVTFT